MGTVNTTALAIFVVLILGTLLITAWSARRSGTRDYYGYEYYYYGTDAPAGGKK